MADAESQDFPAVEPDPQSTAPPCRHLRSKGMYVYTDGISGEEHDGYDNTIFWCLETMKGYGPDEDFVGREECRNPSRSCYEPL
jgi:hypothetical protein